MWVIFTIIEQPLLPIWEEIGIRLGLNKKKLNDRAVNAWLLDVKDADIHMKQTLFHEIGHAIDDLAPGSNARFSKSSKFKFKEAMIKDMKEMNNRVI